MKLTYRGIEYDYNPPTLAVTESDTTICQYRGQRKAYTYVRHVPIPQPAERLTYRGVAYQTTRQGQVQPIGMPTEGTAAQLGQGMNLAQNLRSKLAGNSSAAQARRGLLSESSQMHQNNIARALAHRIEAAKAAGNQTLIEQLEAEMHQSVSA